MCFSQMWKSNQQTMTRMLSSKNTHNTKQHTNRNKQAHKQKQSETIRNKQKQQLTCMLTQNKQTNKQTNKQQRARTTNRNKQHSYSITYNIRQKNTCTLCVIKVCTRKFTMQNFNSSFLRKVDHFEHVTLVGHNIICILYTSKNNIICILYCTVQTFFSSDLRKVDNFTGVKFWT